MQQVYRDERKNCIVYLRHAYRDVVNRAAREEVTLRQAAYEIAIERVTRAETLRGI